MFIYLHDQQIGNKKHFKSCYYHKNEKNISGIYRLHFLWKLNIFPFHRDRIHKSCIDLLIHVHILGAYVHKCKI